MSHEEQVKDAERSMELLETCRRRRFNKGRHHSAHKTESLRSAPPKVADGGRVQEADRKHKIACICHVSDRGNFAVIIRRTPEINGPQSRRLRRKNRRSVLACRTSPRKTRSCMRSSLSRSPKATILVRRWMCVQRIFPRFAKSDEAPGSSRGFAVRRCKCTDVSIRQPFASFSW
jgi:hypothetical protein